MLSEQELKTSPLFHDISYEEYLSLLRANAIPGDERLRFRNAYFTVSPSGVYAFFKSTEEELRPYICYIIYQTPYLKSAEIKQRLKDLYPKFTLIDQMQQQNLATPQCVVDQTIRNVLQEDYRLGIIRYSEEYDRYYKSMLEEKNLSYELVAEFPLVLAMGRDCPLAQRETVTETQLADYVELAHADPMVPALSMTEVRRAELPETVRRRIFVFERASQFEILSELPDTFMWASPIPKPVLQRYGLIQTECAAPRNDYKDVLVSLKHYQYTETEHIFIEALKKTVEQLRARV